MSDRDNAKSRDGTLYRVFCCFGREIPVYYQYSDEDGNAIPNYPDFRTDPLYTDDGRPLVTVSGEGCPYYEPTATGEATCTECGCCKYFRTETDFSVFGICTNGKRLFQTEKGRENHESD